MTITIEARAAKEFMNTLAGGLHEIVEELKINDAIVLESSIKIGETDLRPSVKVTDNITRKQIFPSNGCDESAETTLRGLQEYLVKVKSAVQAYLLS